MRVVGGRLGGRRLASPPRRSTDVRPTSDRAREAIFSILAGAVEGASVLDLFCGTGALGIEALSRGARAAVLVDQHPDLARRNVRDLGLDGSCQIVRADVLAYLREPARHAGRRFDLVFCDPPYRLADRFEGEVDSLVSARLAEGGRVIAESAARHPLTLALPLLDERRYGEASVRIYGAEET